MKSIRIISTIILLSLFLAHCSSSKETQKDSGKDEATKTEAYSPTIELNVDNITSWLGENLAKEKKFHVSGDVIIPSSKNYDLKNIELRKVNVFQDGDLFYSVFPTVQLKKESDLEKEFLFSTIQGLEINPMFNYDDPFTVEIIIGEGGQQYSFRVENNMVQKVQ